MKPISVTSVITFVLSFFFVFTAQSQTIGVNASAVWLTDCTQSNYFNTTGSGAALIGPPGNDFTNNNFGSFTQNSGTLILRGGQVKTFKVPGVSNVCSARMYYRTYLQSGTPGAFNSIDLPLTEDCNAITGQYPSGGTCVAGDQKWSRVIPNGATTPYAPVNLTAMAPGNYVLEVYYEISGSSVSTTLCDETVVLNNSGNNYLAYFSIQAPVLSSTNPTTCNGSQGSITISGLTAGTSYTINYYDDGNPIGPLVLVANASGQVTISGLNAGVYSEFEVIVNGCTTQLNTGLILSNPVYTPTFSAIPPFCAGSTPPTLPTTSNNGYTGTWNPAVINNQASGSYTFTPDAGQCAINITRNVTVNPNVVPTFSFGTTLTICDGGIVPALPNTSTNGITGTWSPAVVDNQNSGTYTFTPTAGICATGTSFTVTVNPNVTPTFSFGTSLDICAGGSVPALPTTSSNGITGTWSPATVDNQNSGTYTFTPTAGLCATAATFTVNVTPNTIPNFSFGSSLSICSGGSVPTLPTTSDNGVAGTWSPATVSNTASGTYTFTPAPGICATPVTFTVTVNPNITPTFTYGTTLTICEGGSVPALVNTSVNGFSGTWSPATVSNTASGTYTFTPDAGQCATTATFTVTVNPNQTPTFSFGTALTICAGESVPGLPTTSDNGIAGTWSPATVSNTASGTYTFTPNAGICATPYTYSVTVNPNVTPTFSFGTTLTICSGGSVPTLVNTSDNGITGTWSPATVSNTASGTYTFTPTAGLCATTTTLTVTVSPNITPTFTFGTTLTICADGSVPALTTSSTNGITGTWSPATVDNQNSGVYTFTPDAGQCATNASFTVTVNPNVTPTFSFGTTLAICSGGTVPALTNTSSNGITGTWSPATVSNTASGTYTFTPTAGICAIPVTFTVTVNNNATPAFSFGTTLTICAGESVPTLPATSTNGITGTWSPATVDNQASGVYTFTPDAGQCATTATFTVTVNPNITPTFSFGTTLTICDGGTVPALPNTSSNGIAGTWSPAIVDNQNSGVYTFTPNAGICAVSTSFTVTVNPNLTPAFSFGTSLTICQGTTAPALPATSQNGITGTWSPASIDNQANGTYTFTPSAGQCATNTTLTVTVTPNTIPTFSFGNTLTICAGGSVPALPASSDNGVNGTWSPATVDNQASGVYTFTPAAGVCATTFTYTVTVTPNTIPTFSFGTSLNICTGGTVPALPNTSSNGVAGTWSPALVDDQASGVYTFTPNAGICATTTTFSVTVNPIVTPAFSFGNSLTICAGSSVPALPATSTNGITGTWSPATVDNQASGTYTFTPAAGQCANTITFSVTVTPNTTPVFSFGSTLTICAGDVVPALPNISDNGVNGTWSPAIIDNQNSAVYTFTADAGICATTVTYTVTVNPNVTPTFSFGTALAICNGGSVPALVTTSSNGITGTWSPATVDNQNSGTYTFTPTPGLCATTTTFTVTVSSNTTPTFSFGPTLTICQGGNVPTLPTTSDNGVAGTWSPAMVSDQSSGTYTFTPAAGACAGSVTFTVTVTPNTIPTFSFGTGLTICVGGTVPALPTTSNNGLTGTWSPAVVDNQASGVYTFTPDPIPGECLAPATFIVTVNPILTPVFDFGTTMDICSGSSVPTLPTTSSNGITGVWSPATISNLVSGTYTFTSNAGQCATPTATLTVTVLPVANINLFNSDTTVNDGAIVPGTNIIVTPAGSSFTWTNSNPSIGLAASGTGNVPSFTATNSGSTPISGTITITPSANGCTGTPRTYVITVMPLVKDVFVPNVFSPNGDGKNDLLMVYGNYISKVDMRIFNQWGEQVQRITDKSTGWDGRHQGKPQPVGVYVYALEVTMNDGRKIKMKGHITLIR